MISFLNIMEGSNHNVVVCHQGHIIKILALLTFYALSFSLSLLFLIILQGSYRFSREGFSFFGYDSQGQIPRDAPRRKGYIFPYIPLNPLNTLWLFFFCKMLLIFFFQYSWKMHMIPIQKKIHKYMHIIKKNDCNVLKLQHFSIVLPNVDGNALFWRGQ